MKKRFKKLVLPLSLIGMLSLGSTSVFANNIYNNINDNLSYNNETIQNTVNFDYNLNDIINNIDINNETTYQQTKNLNELEITVNFIPNKDYFRSTQTGTTDAKVGSLEVGFKSKLGLGYLKEMTYVVDIDKSNSNWEIESAYNLNYKTGLMVEAKSTSLNVIRKTSSSNLDAKAVGQVVCSLFDNNWITIGESTYSVTTAINNKGKLTLTINY